MGAKNVLIKGGHLNEKFIFTRPAFNVRNNEIGALIGIEQLKRLDNMIQKRAKNFELKIGFHTVYRAGESS